MDYRDVAANLPDWFEFDEKRMQIRFEPEEGEEIEASAQFVVCGVCDGKGSHVNPSIDAHGITGEEWAEWGDDEKESYLAGGYDVPCNRCGGRRVVPTIDEHEPAHVQKAFHARARAQWALAREISHEQEMGY